MSGRYRNLFAFTPAEERLLKLYRMGATASQIKGLTGDNETLYNAIEKDRLRAHLERESPHKPAAGTTLAKARRTLRPKTDVRIGKWKSGE